MRPGPEVVRWPALVFHRRRVHIAPGQDAYEAIYKSAADVAGADDVALALSQWIQKKAIIRHEPTCDSTGSQVLSDCTCDWLDVDVPEMVGPPPPEVRIVVAEWAEQALEFAASDHPVESGSELAAIKNARDRAENLRRRTRAHMTEIEDAMGVDAFTDTGFAGALELYERLEIIDAAIDLGLEQIDRKIEEARALRRAARAPDPPAPPPVKVDVSCSNCRRRPRHFDDLCKRCANALGRRPSGKVV